MVRKELLLLQGLIVLDSADRQKQQEQRWKTQTDEKKKQHLHFGAGSYLKELFDRNLIHFFAAT
ncbi:hypothetical protein ES703_114215 [subsurface metagenome]